MTNDAKALLRSARFKLRRDRVEFGIRRPVTATRKVLVATPERAPLVHQRNHQISATMVRILMQHLPR